jgi:PAS domain S-box-containing protein
MIVKQRRVAPERPVLPEGIYKRIFDTALDGILVLSHPEGLVAAANPYLLGLIGYDIEDIVGRKLWQLGFLVDKEDYSVTRSTDLYKKLFVGAGLKILYE